jgi:hypothetical protein
MVEVRGRLRSLKVGAANAISMKRKLPGDSEGVGLQDHLLHEMGWQARGEKFDQS